MEAHRSYNQPEDWVFASTRKKGKQPYAPDSLLKRNIRPAAVRAKIAKHVGWHTFRRTFTTLLKDNGADVKVMQELLRHATVKMTLEVILAAHLHSDDFKKLEATVNDLMESYWSRMDPVWCDALELLRGGYLFGGQPQWWIDTGQGL